MLNKRFDVVYLLMRLSWVTRRFKDGCRWLAVPLILLLAASNLYAVSDLLSIQGNVYSGGAALGSGNVSFKLSADACASFFYDSGSDFNDTIYNGQFDVSLGNESLTVLTVDVTERYLYLQEFVNGAIQTWNQTGGTCLPFSNPFYLNNDTVDQRISVFNSSLSGQFLNLSGTNANQNIDINGYNLTTGNLIPATNDTYDLGLNTSQFRTLYLTKDIWFDTNRYIQWVSPTLTIRGGGIQFQVSDLVNVKLGYTSSWFYQNAIFNYANYKRDFTIRGDVSNDLFQVNGTNESIGIMTNVLSQTFNVNGTSNFTDNASFSQNVSGNWFNGLFNWTCADSNCSFNGSSLQIYPASASASPIARSVNYERVLMTSAGSLSNNVENANITRSMPRTETGAGYPFYVPRTINVTLINGDAMFGVAAEINITGIDQDGNDIYDYFANLSINPGGRDSWQTDHAYAIVYNYTFNASTLGGLFPFVVVELGRGEWIGLPNYPLTSVYKYVADGYYPIETISTNLTAGTVYHNYSWDNVSATFWYVS